jgi:aspartyl-tRNA synthetase
MKSLLLNQLISVQNNELFQYFTHKCNDIDSSLINQNIVIFGWLRNKRDLGGMIFIEINDGTDTIQVVCDNIEIIDILSPLHVESVLQIEIKIIFRSQETINKNLRTGKIEGIIQNLFIFSKSNVLPLCVNTDEKTRDDITYKYRSLDLRRQVTKKIINSRCEFFKETRLHMWGEGFQEVQTPLLTSSAPEGARDFLVMSYNFPGEFYSLPQAPQIYKQLLACGGISRYFQIAPCFRAESARLDRLPGEFFQLDLEIGFGNRTSVMDILWKYVQKMFKKFAPHKEINEKKVFLSYSESMKKYASDKPDLRNPLIIENVTEFFLTSHFDLFKNSVLEGKEVFCIKLKNKKPRSFFDGMLLWSIENYKKNIAYAFFNEGWKGPIGKFLDDSFKTNDGENGIFFYCDFAKNSYTFLNKMREKIGEDLINKNQVSLAIITEFPMFEYDEEKELWDFMHNPFSRPMCSIDKFKKQDIKEIISCQYDLICNGFELGSGAERNASLEGMEESFFKVGKGREYFQSNFPSLYNAFCYGVPPHAGMAIGMERLLMLLTDNENVRSVVPFPMNQNGRDLLMGAPFFLNKQQKLEIMPIIKELIKN